MAIASMTGFARGEGAAEGCSWTWEVRSVNARGLEVRCRLPGGFEGLEPAVRQCIGRHLRRGSVFASLSLTYAAGKLAVRLNEDVLARILAIIPKITRHLPGAPPPSADALLGLRGVIDLEDGTPTGEARERLDRALQEALDRLLPALVAGRRAEGARLAPVLLGHVGRVSTLADAAGTLAAAQPAAIFQRLRDQIEALLGAQPALPADRLAQEAALLAVKADPREEIDRLKAHAEAAHALLDQDGPIGRQLDFLCQELNREANTLCAKSSDVALTRVGIEIKTTIDQLREQVQNIE
jgi:uncharacterized protein (TIGR00255 family)